MYWGVEEVNEEVELSAGDRAIVNEDGITKIASGEKSVYLEGDCDVDWEGNDACNGSGDVVRVGVMKQDASGDWDMTVIDVDVNGSGEEFKLLGE